jgi:hypothetical protein
MYKYLYVQFYLFSDLTKIKGSFYNDSAFGGVYYLTGFEAFLTVSLVLWFKLPIITFTRIMDLVIMLLLIFSINLYLFLYKKRYKKIISQYDDLSHSVQLLYGVSTIIICAIIFIFFLYMISENVPPKTGAS